jgi:hypothetical protein
MGETLFIKDILKFTKSSISPFLPNQDLLAKTKIKIFKRLFWNWI